MIFLTYELIKLIIEVIKFVFFSMRVAWPVGHYQLKIIVSTTALGSQIKKILYHFRMFPILRQKNWPELLCARNYRAWKLGFTPWFILQCFECDIKLNSLCLKGFYCYNKIVKTFSEMANISSSLIFRFHYTPNFVIKSFKIKDKSNSIPAKKFPRCRFSDHVIITTIK